MFQYESHFSLVCPCTASLPVIYTTVCAHLESKCRSYHPNCGFVSSHFFPPMNCSLFHSLVVSSALLCAGAFTLNFFPASSYSISILTNLSLDQCNCWCPSFVSEVLCGRVNEERMFSEAQHFAPRDSDFWFHALRRALSLKNSDGLILCVFLLCLFVCVYRSVCMCARSCGVCVCVCQSGVSPVRVPQSGCKRSGRNVPCGVHKCLCVHETPSLAAGYPNDHPRSRYRYSRNYSVAQPKPKLMESPGLVVLTNMRDYSFVGLKIWSLSSPCYAMIQMSGCLSATLTVYVPMRDPPTVTQTQQLPVTETTEAISAVVTTTTMTTTKQEEKKKAVKRTAQKESDDDDEDEKERVPMKRGRSARALVTKKTEKPSSKKIVMDVDTDFESDEEESDDDDFMSDCESTTKARGWGVLPQSTKKQTSCRRYLSDPGPMERVPVPAYPIPLPRQFGYQVALEVPLFQPDVAVEFRHVLSSYMLP